MMKALWSLVVCFSCFASVWADPPKIAICQIVEHHALDQMREGIQLAMEGEDITWSIENAQGNPALAAQIAQKVTGEGPDLIIGLATPMAQALASVNSKTPLLFGAVTDPVDAKLVQSLKTPGKNITGVVDVVPLADVLDLMSVVLPEAKKIGVIYNPGETNSVQQVATLKKLAKKRGLTIIEATATKSSEVMGATRRLVSRADAILLPTDNTVISALEAVTKPAIRNKVPVVGIDVDTVRRGAVMALGVDWHSLGEQLGAMAKGVLEGKDPSETPVEMPKQLYFHVNKGTAEKIGLHLDPKVLEKVDKVYQ